MSEVLTRVLLIALLVLLAIRALGRLLGGVVRGLTPPAPPDKGVQMVRDPVCGTFVVPSRALMLSDGHEARFFCSEKCRAAYSHRKPCR
ncbi:MAG: hypothetical protein ACE148_05220 [Vicinamibacterales bacterium]